MFGFKRRAEAKRHEENLSLRRRGYDYAAGKLVRGEDCRIFYELAENEDSCGTGLAEKGICDAVHDWKKKIGRNQ